MSEKLEDRSDNSPMVIEPVMMTYYIGMPEAMVCHLDCIQPRVRPHCS